MIKDYLEEPNKIEITNENLKNIHISNIVCFSFASPGAMGDGGALILGYKKKDFNIYYFNLCQNSDFKLVDNVIDTLFLPLIGRDDQIENYDPIQLDYIGDVPGFDCIPMGYGNNFYIRQEYFKEFEKMCLNFDKTLFVRIGALYKWQKVVMNLFFNSELKQQKENLNNFKPTTILGAIIGDIVGSRFEFSPHRSKEFELFYCDSGNKIPKTISEYRNNSRFTDDTVMTVAIAKALIDANGDYTDLEKLVVKNMKKYGKKYPFAGYGAKFNTWLQLPFSQPYNSYGNGSAMRISAVPYIAKDIMEVAELSERVTAVTHNHPEGIKGANAVAECIWYALHKTPKSDIQKYVEEYYYNLDFDYDDLVKNYTHDESCQNSVPQSIYAFLISDSYEDTIRTAVSMGGDSDTMCAIAGSIAAAYYGIPQHLVDEALGYLPQEFKEIIDKFNEKYIKENHNG